MGPKPLAESPITTHSVSIRVCGDQHAWGKGYIERVELQVQRLPCAAHGVRQGSCARQVAEGRDSTQPPAWALCLPVSKLKDRSIWVAVRLPKLEGSEPAHAGHHQNQRAGPCALAKQQALPLMLLPERVRSSRDVMSTQAAGRLPLSPVQCEIVRLVIDSQLDQPAEVPLSAANDCMPRHAGQEIPRQPCCLHDM